MENMRQTRVMESINPTVTIKRTQGTVKTMVVINQRITKTSTKNIEETIVMTNLKMISLIMIIMIIMMKINLKVQDTTTTATRIGWIAHIRTNMKIIDIQEIKIIRITKINILGMKIIQKVLETGMITVPKILIIQTNH